MFYHFLHCNKVLKLYDKSIRSHAAKPVLDPDHATVGTKEHVDWLLAQVEDITANAQFGDLIEFSYPVGFSHWGVYDGDGHVIHFAVAGKTLIILLFHSVHNVSYEQL